MAPALAKTNLIDNFVCCAAGVCRSGELKGQHDVFKRVQGRHQMKRLKHETHAFGTNPRSSVFIKLAQIMTVQLDMSFCWQIQSCQKRE